MTLEHTGELIRQVQIAHRLAAGYYKKLFTTLDNMASELDLAFWKWDTTDTGRLPRASKQPSTVWAWEFLPMYASSQAYGRFDRSAPQVGDMAVHFEAYVEETFEEEANRRPRARNEPDPVDMPKGGGLLKAALYVMATPTGRTLEHVWDDLALPDGDAWEDMEAGVVGCLLTWPLYLALTEPALVIRTLRERIARLGNTGQQRTKVIKLL